MHANGKKFRSASERRKIGTPYDSKKAIELVKQMAFAKFDETVDVAIRLGVDPRHADQVVRGTVVLPEGTGSTVRVLVIAVGDKAREAEAAGADYVGVETATLHQDREESPCCGIVFHDQQGGAHELSAAYAPLGNRFVTWTKFALPPAARA